MKRISYAVLLGALAFSLNATAKDGHGAHWEYKGETGPEKWGDLAEEFAVCKTGKSQSPVDLKAGIDAELPKLKFDYQAVPLKVLNNGHTIQMDQKGAGKAKIDGKDYDLLQFHFHAPSEHTVDGKVYPMEVHLVHKNAEGRLAVVGIMIKEGKENAALKAAWDNMPEKGGEEKTVSGAKINPTDLLPKGGQDFHRYAGSLTTPPCSEGVLWTVLKDPIEMSAAQIDKFKTVVHENARPVQPLHDRFLLDRK